MNVNGNMGSSVPAWDVYEFWYGAGKAVRRLLAGADCSRQVAETMRDDLRAEYDGVPGVCILIELSPVPGPALPPPVPVEINTAAPRSRSYG